MLHVPSIVTLAASMSPPIHVTVSSGSGWLTLVIAILGLMLASLSLGWQCFTWFWSGSQVQVDATFTICTKEGEVLYHMRVFSLSEDYLKKSQFPPGFQHLIIATIRNTGRLPVTIQGCWWQTDNGEFGATRGVEYGGRVLGVSLPHRLEAHDQCFSVIKLKSVMNYFDYNNPPKRHREVRPVVYVASKRGRVRGKAVAIPQTLALNETHPSPDGLD